MMLKYTITALALLAITPTITACDADAEQDSVECSAPALDGSEPFVVSPVLRLVAPADAPPPAEYSFREQGPPSAEYISSVNGQPIHAKQFVQAVTACIDKGDPTWLLTLSWYQPDTTKDGRVLGLGGSTMASSALLECFDSWFKGNGAIALP